MCHPAGTVFTPLCQGGPASIIVCTHLRRLSAVSDPIASDKLL
ncbi:hypothetical protein [Novosphingobium clariflavum]|uniref:Uncharacterized protein n=1 Tax=Novosphingobium clariflavum TaxID=2029884 RepID=A0ABV6S4B2_9SPHN|nr:hypothetical protein [Novosphingobium clariflavum]